jgi:hypothetical protein
VCELRTIATNAVGIVCRRTTPAAIRLSWQLASAACGDMATAGVPVPARYCVGNFPQQRGQSPRRRERQSSVFGWSALHPVDHDDVERNPVRFELQSETFDGFEG